MSVHLQIAINVADKSEGSKERHRAQHEEEHVTPQHCVAKELDSLQHTIHVWALVVVEEGVSKHKQTGWPEHESGGEVSHYMYWERGGEVSHYMYWEGGRG